MPFGAREVKKIIAEYRRLLGLYFLQWALSTFPTKRERGMLGALLTPFLKGVIDHKEPTEEPVESSDELDDLVQQERHKQAVPLMAWTAVNAPVDVKTLTLILQYEDDKRLVMECGRPERMEVEP